MKVCGEVFDQGSGVDQVAMFISWHHSECIRKVSPEGPIGMNFSCP